MILSSLKTYWSGTSALQSALPISQVYLDLVPEGTAFPYARITTLGGGPDYMTGGTHIENFHYQLAIYHTDLDALSSTGATVESYLNRSYPTAATMSHSKTNLVLTTEVVNGLYVYGYVLDYEWVYNSSLN